MIEFLWGIVNSIISMIGDFLNQAGVLAVITFNPLAPFLETLTGVWASVAPTWRAINTFVPYHYVSDAAGVLITSFIFIILAGWLWRIIKASF